MEEGSSPGAAGDALRTALEAAAAETPPATSSRQEGDVGEENVAKGVLHAVAAPHGLSLSARASCDGFALPAAIANDGGAQPTVCLLMTILYEQT